MCWVFCAGLNSDLGRDKMYERVPVFCCMVNSAAAAENVKPLMACVADVNNIDI